MSYETLLDKLGQPVSWFRDAPEHNKREEYVLSELQKKYPGNYVLEEYYNPDKMCFKYRLKFPTEADEMWFNLKYQ